MYLSREFIKNHTQWNFVFGMDYKRKGFFGQANSCFNEPNTFPVSTCLSMCKSSGYFDDFNPDFKLFIKEDLAKIPLDKPIIPLRKIGEGASQMKYFAPRLFSYLRNELDKIKYPNIKIDYK